MNDGHKKLIVISLISVLTLIGSYIALTQYFNEKKVKQEVVKLLEEALPQSNVQIDELNVRYGPSIQVYGRGLSSHFFNVENFEVKLPLVSMITGGGNIEVLLRKTKLTLIAKEKGDMVNKADPVTLSIPFFLANSSGSFRFEELSVSYQNNNKTRNYQIDRFILKNIGLRSTAAFELKSKMKLAVKESEVAGNVSIFGSINIEHYIKKGILPFNANYKVQDIKIDNFSDDVNTLSGKLILNLQNNGDLTGSVDTLYQNSKFYAEGSLDDKKLMINKMSFNLEGDDFNPLLRINKWSEQRKKALLKGEGTLLWDDKKIVPEINIELVNFSLPLLKKPVLLNGDLSLKKERLSGKVSSQSFGGLLEFDGFANLIFGETFTFHQGIRNYNFVFKLKETDNLSQEAFVKEFSRLVKDDRGQFILLPNGRVHFKLEDARIKRSVVSGNIEVLTNLENVNISGEGKGDISWKVKETFKLGSNGYKREGESSFTGKNLARFFEFISYQNPVVQETASYAVKSKYKYQVDAKETTKNLKLDIKGTKLALKENYILSKVETLKEDLEKWKLWSSIKKDIVSESQFDGYSLSLKRTNESTKVQRLSMNRGQRKVIGNGNFVNEGDFYTGNLDIKISKPKSRPIKIFINKNKKGFFLDKRKILKQF